MWTSRQACKYGSTLLSSMAQLVACSLQSNYAGQQLPGIDAACLSIACAVLSSMQDADSCSFVLNAWQVLCPASDMHDQCNLSACQEPLSQEMLLHSSSQTC